MPAWEPVVDGDVLISFNFRKDRPRQMVGALGSEHFAGFDRGASPRFRIFCMMQYDSTLEMPVAFAHEAPQMTLSQVVSAAGLRQLHCAETEKYAHVTYFLDGGSQDPAAGERHLVIPSPRVATYDQKPEMSAPQVADSVVNALESREFAFIVVNFANGDMVGHTAVPQAVIRAVEALDREVGRVLDAAVASGYSVVLTADHGNCEEMVDPATGAPNTQHTCYPVPCLIVDEAAWQLSSAGGLANIAPTVLQLLGLPKPAAMQASSLLLQACGEGVGARRFEGAA
jgi:2,3-bisphosphoglycerate-independent phosphoglycerate mutase